MRNLKNQDLGFNQRNLLLFQLDPRRAGYSGKKIDDVYQQILERLETIPGVRGVTSSHMALLSGWINNGAISTDGPKVPAGQSINVDNNPVGPGFFETMGIRVLLGRGIDWRDIRAHRRTAVVNESLARYFYPNMNPVGRHFNFGEPRNPAYDYEIAGVVADAKYDRLRDVPPRTVYIPFNAEANSIGGMYVEVRTAGEPLAALPEVRRVIRDVDPNLSLFEVKTQTEQIEEGMREERMFAQLSVVFGGLALLLVCVGLYGTLSYAVARRTNDIGIRMALGAPRPGVLWMILRESLVLICIGACAGLPIALGLTRYVASELYGVKPNDVATIASTCAVLAIVGAVAGFLPAWRAARIEPIIALRYE